MVLSLFLLVSMLPLGCDNPPEPLPTRAEVEQLDEADRATPPPLYQLLYDSAFLPEVQYEEQKTRILIWLRYVGMQEHQLRHLLALHERAAVLRNRVQETQREIIEGFEPQLLPTYRALFQRLSEGVPLDDPQLERDAAALLETRLQEAREEELLAVRMQSVRALLDEEQEFLRQLTPEQEILFPDVLFVLRRDIDHAATPGDFRALVGTLFSAGEPTLLLRGDFSTDRQPLNLGGLWSDAARDELSAPVLHEARRELLLYLLLQEPALPDAVDGALQALGVPEEQRVPEMPKGGGDGPPPGD